MRGQGSQVVVWRSTCGRFISGEVEEFGEGLYPSPEVWDWGPEWDMPLPGKCKLHAAKITFGAYIL